MSTARITEQLPEEKKLDALIAEVKAELGVEFIRDEGKALDALIKMRMAKTSVRDEPVQHIKRFAK